MRPMSSPWQRALAKRCGPGGRACAISDLVVVCTFADEPSVLNREAALCPTVIQQAGPETPRAECGSVVELPGGKLLAAYMKYAPNKEGASDFGWCCIWSRSSPDHGRTWIEPRRLVDVVPGDLNVQALALLRLPSGESW
jgi:hypothetical protein